MLRAILVAAALAAPVAAAPQSPSGIVINELAYNDTSTDDFEFVEIYNAGTAAVDLTGWTLEEVDLTTGTNGNYVFPSLILNPGEFWVVGDPNVPNVDDAPQGLDLENGADGVALQDGNFVVQDTVIWKLADATLPPPATAEGGMWGDTFSHVRAGVLAVTLGRGIDGVDTDDNACDFRPQTASPGELNILTQDAALPYENNFDDAVGTTVEGDFTYSFTPGNVQDPAAVTVAIIGGIVQPPQAFPASPQGGNITLWHDPTGGGNANWLNNFTQENVMAEAYMYLPPVSAVDPLLLNGDLRVMGVRGHSDSYGEHPDIGGWRSLIACGSGTTIQTGHTGIAWVHQRTSLISDLYLIDFNNGGDDPIILAGPIAITSGVNDGWQRLRLCVAGTDIVANFGGNYGCDDGDRYTATTNTTCANGGCYLTYRECFDDNNNATPLMLDALLVTECTSAGSTLVGTAFPTPFGTPTISENSASTIGNATYAINGSGMIPGNPLTGLIADFGPALPFGVQIAGAPLGAELWVNPTVILVQAADGLGNVTYSIPIPCISPGGLISYQLFDWDLFSGTTALPLGMSQGLETVLGY